MTKPPLRVFAAAASAGVALIVAGLLTSLWLAAVGACLVVAPLLGYALREAVRPPRSPPGAATMGRTTPSAASCR